MKSQTCLYANSTDRSSRLSFLLLFLLVLPGPRSFAFIPLSSHLCSANQPLAPRVAHVPPSAIVIKRRVRGSSRVFSRSYLRQSSLQRTRHGRIFFGGKRTFPVAIFFYILELTLSNNGDASLLAIARNIRERCKVWDRTIELILK